MRRTYSTRERACTTTSLAPPAHNGGATKFALVPLKKRKTRIRRKVKLAPDLQHARACLYNNFLAPPAHNGSSARLRLFHRKTEEPQTTENKLCAGFTMRDSALLQQLPCSAGAQRRSGKTCGCSAKKAENPHTTENKVCAGLQGRAGRVPKAERLEGMTTPEKPIAKTVCAQV